MTLPNVLPMKLTDVGPEKAQLYIDDDAWVMSQKLDGARVMLRYDISDTGQRRFFWTNDGVKPLAFSAALLHLPMLNVQLAEIMDREGIVAAIFDGELIIETGVYHVFDVLHLETDDSLQVDVSDVLSYRLIHLESLPQTSHIQIAYVARTREEKAALYAALEAGNVEGAVSKLLTSSYVPISVKGGVHRTKEWVKHKFVKTADVVVTAVERKFDAKGMVTHGSAALAVPIQPEQDPEPLVNAKGRRAPLPIGAHPATPFIPDHVQGVVRDKILKDWESRSFPDGMPKGFEYAPRTLLPIGNASLIGKELTIDVGSVVEIRYLYWTGEAVVQPAILRQRFDKPAEDCDLDQFPEYTRKIVEVTA